LPTLAIVFASVKQDYNALCELLSNNNIDSLGLTSCGEFIDGHLSEGETALLLLDLPPSHYKIVFEEIDGRIFTYGEQGPDPSGSCAFHSGACC
jgi:hypothetical protein